MTNTNTNKHIPNLYKYNRDCSDARELKNWQHDKMNTAMLSCFAFACCFLGVSLDFVFGSYLFISAVRQTQVWLFVCSCVFFLCFLYTNLFVCLRQKQVCAVRKRGGGWQTLGGWQEWQTLHYRLVAPALKMERNSALRTLGYAQSLNQEDLDCFRHFVFFR